MVEILDLKKWPMYVKLSLFLDVMLCYASTRSNLNILSIGIIASYNFKLDVPSGVPTNGYYVESKNLKTQDYLNRICEWTSANKMELNKTKSHAMIFNFT